MKARGALQTSGGFLYFFFLPFFAVQGLRVSESEFRNHSWGRRARLGGGIISERAKGSRGEGEEVFFRGC